MKSSYIRDHYKVLAGLAACGALCVLAVVLALSSGSGSGGTSASTSPSREFSALQPVSASAKEALPAQAADWLAEMEGPTLANPDSEKLVGLSSTDTKAGEIVVADFGQNVCIYLTDHAMSTCGTTTLIEAGKLLTVAPSCEGRVVVVGILPDEVKSVKIGPAEDDATEGIETVPVTSNIYAAEIEPVDTVVSGTTESGRSFETEVPLGQLRGSPVGAANCPKS
jgi:hypothetical protein